MAALLHDLGHLLSGAADDLGKRKRSRAAPGLSPSIAGLLVYMNGRAAERMLGRVRGVELRRVRLRATLTELWPELTICEEAAYDAYAIHAFEEGALDYVLKPISLDRMKLTVRRLQEPMREPPADLRNLADLIKTFVKPETQYLKWLTVHGKLDPAVFWPIHRSTVVNISAIDIIYRSFLGALEIKLEDRKDPRAQATLAELANDPDLTDDVRRVTKKRRRKC